MPKVVFRAADGVEREVIAPERISVMEAAVKNDLPGIDADCGGACACATCHVFVDESWLAKLPPQSEMERSMLEFAEGVRPNSRLSCQLPLTAALDGLVVETPESQH